MSADAQRQARSREVRFLVRMLEGKEWRASSLASALSKLGYLEPVMRQRESCAWFAEELRTVLAHAEGTSWGVNLGLWLHLVEKVPLRTIRRFRQAASEKYNAESNSYARKVLWANPFDESDHVPYPYTIPAPCSFDTEMREYAEAHGLTTVGNGKAAQQQVRRPCYLTKVLFCVCTAITRSHYPTHYLSCRSSSPT